MLRGSLFPKRAEAPVKDRPATRFAGSGVQHKPAWWRENIHRIPKHEDFVVNTRDMEVH